MKIQKTEIMLYVKDMQETHDTMKAAGVFRM